MTERNKFLNNACPRYDPEAPACQRCADVVANFLKQTQKLDVRVIEIGFDPKQGIVVHDEVVHALLARTNKVTFTKCSPFCG